MMDMAGLNRDFNSKVKGVRCPRELAMNSDCMSKWRGATAHWPIKGKYKCCDVVLDDSVDKWEFRDIR